MTAARVQSEGCRRRGRYGTLRRPRCLGQSPPPRPGPDLLRCKNPRRDAHRQQIAAPRWTRWALPTLHPSTRDLVDCGDPVFTARGWLGRWGGEILNKLAPTSQLPRREMG
ncbi:unnamed protein product [Lampetra planeri]